MNEILDSKKEFSILRHAKSFVHAGRGLWVFVKTTPNAWVHGAALTLVVVLGLALGITRIEWALVACAVGFVLIAEAFNTALEIDINLTSPGYHPYAKDVKDVAAGAVLIATVVAIVVGLLVFVPYIV